MALRGDVRVEADVPQAYAQLLASTIAQSSSSPFVLACSGSSSGAAALGAAIALGTVDWARCAVVFADERCVATDSPDSNERLLREVFGSHLDELAGFYPMRCADGPSSYEKVLACLGGLDFVQLGMGPDGHTASLFAGSAGLDAPAGRWVIENADPSGNNRYDRLSLTLEAIATSPVVAICVVGAEKSAALSSLRDGADLPAARVTAEHLVWLIDAAAWEPQ